MTARTRLTVLLPGARSGPRTVAAAGGGRGLAHLALLLLDELAHLRVHLAVVRRRGLRGQVLPVVADALRLLAHGLHKFTVNKL
jgi:hypothetical protein